MSLMKGNLNHLATELLNTINMYLDDTELFVLALVSKRLHVIALTSCIARRKKSDSWTNIVYDNQIFLSGASFPLLKPLRMAIFIRRLIQLSFGVTSRPPETDVLLFSLRGLQRFISHLSTLSNAEFNFGEAKPRGHAGDHRVQETIRDLLESLIGKTCSQLHITSWRLRDESSDSRRVAKSASLSRRNIQPLTSLKRMTISRSDIHSQEPFKWLLESMNLSQINDLTLHEVSFRSKQQTIGRFLQSLTLPLLTNFHITSHDIKLDQLVKFLLRHKSITSLEVGKSTSINLRTTPSLPTGLLPNLSRLKLDPSWTRHFLASPTSLPNLNATAIEPNYPMWEREFSETIISRCMEPLEQCFVLISTHQSINHLKTKFPGGSWSVDWLKSRIDTPIERSAEHTLVHIRAISLDLVAPSPPFYDDVDPLLVQWLARFPSLQTVDFGLWSFNPATHRRQAILAGIAEACPTVVSVRLGIFSHSMDKLRSR